VLTVTPTDIPAVKLVEPKRSGDSCGYFIETWNKKRFAEHGLDFDFVQDNESLSTRIGTVRGMHFQKHPNAQDNLVRGRAFDVAVDLRKSSPSYGKHAGVELSAENGRQLLIPIGFAHGFCTLEPDVVVAYKVTDSGADHLGLAWDDPDLAIRWPVDPAQAALSEDQPTYSIESGRVP
jgi:dTDP-4-dehydrorhamnose 3,5-epimerase